MNHGMQARLVDKSRGGGRSRVKESRANRYMEGSLQAPHVATSHGIKSAHGGCEVQGGNGLNRAARNSTST
jgi:hypothetical protein